jgi:excisionase family DNA binding protein
MYNLVTPGRHPVSIADVSKTISPTTEEAALAKESSRTLSKLAGQPSLGLQEVRFEFQADGDHPEKESVAIPAAAFRLLLDILNQMALGNAVTLIPEHAELSTQQAAEILKVSRPFVIKLIEDKALACKMVGTHRRVLFSDLMAYKRKSEAEREKVLEELAAEAQDLGMGY